MKFEKCVEKVGANLNARWEKVWKNNREKMKKLKK